MLKRLFAFSVLMLMFTFLSVSIAQEKDQAKTEKKTEKKNDKKETVAKKGNTLESLLNLSNNEILVAKMETSMGTIEIQLFPKEAPKTVKNFVGLGLKRFYNKLIFHRVIDNFMIQGGDPNGDGTGGKSFYGKPFSDEFNKTLRFDNPGMLAMANKGPNTNESQFFITLVPTQYLNDKHTIFGKVINGMDVVQAIGKVKTGKMAGKMDVFEKDKPLKPVVIKSLTFEKIEKK